jgi:hypothetical protein
VLDPARVVQQGRRLCGRLGSRLDYEDQGGGA